jgi:hypothetical protein
MDLPTILVRLTGIVLLAWTLRSIYKHVKEKRLQATAAAGKKEEVQSISEQILNNILLYLWLAFMVTFSIGMIVNN